MNRKGEQELEFYKNGSAESVLKRYKFSDEEEKLVRDAIRTANMQTPRMKLIQEADALLKEVALNRIPITLSEDIDEVELKKKIHMAHYSAPEIRFWKKPIDKSTMPLIGISIWAVFVITFFYYIGS